MMLTTWRQNKKSNEKGFTLVELIIVMAILAVLAGIAVPKFGNVLENSKIKADVASRDLLQNAVDLYYADNNSAYPAGADFAALMANANFVGSDKYIKQVVTASHANGSFTYTVATGKIAYTNTNDKWNTEAEIKAVVPGYED